MLIAIGLAGACLRDVYVGLQSMHWPQTKGTVVKAGLKQTGERNRYTIPVLEYRYSVAGKTFQSDCVAFDMSEYQFSPAGRAQQDLDRYLDGTLMVHYDPKHPGTACLAPGVNWTMAGIQLALPAIVLFLALRRIRRLAS